jgi:hypothetical protein
VFGEALPIAPSISERDEELIRMRRQGASLSQIARRFNSRASACARSCGRMDGEPERALPDLTVDGSMSARGRVGVGG